MRNTLAAPMLALVAGIALAAPGDLDPGFGENGRLNLYTGYQSMQTIDDAVLLADQTIIVVGNDDDFLGDWGTNIVLAKVGTDGSVLTWHAFVDSGGFDDGASRAIATTGDTVTMVGSTCCRPGGYNMAVYRVGTDLSPDTGFGDEGVVLLDLGGDEEGTAVAEATDGSLVVAGRASAAGAEGYWRGQPRGIWLVRLLTDGSQDAAFANGELLFAGEDARAAALVTTTSGKFLLASNHFEGEVNLGCRLTRLTPDGHVDPTFAVGGSLSLSDPVHGAVECRDLLQRGDGRLVVAGTAWMDRGCGAIHCSAAVVASISADGALEPSFNGGFAALPESGAWNAINRVRLDGAGNIVGLGVVRWAPREDACMINDVVVLRVTADGHLDNAFGTNGVSLLGQRERWAGTGGAAPKALLLDGEDRALVGTAEPNWASPDAYTYGGESFATVMRLMASGAGPGIVEFSECPRGYEEGSSTVDVQVRRVGGSSGSARATYASLDWTALAGRDYEMTSGTLDWMDGDASTRTLHLGLLDDEEPGWERIVQLDLLTVTGSTRGAWRYSVRIADDDGTPPVTGSPPPEPAPGQVFAQPGGGGAISLEALYALMAMAAILRARATRKRWSVVEDR
jgi:uncharacterized delta-60 repeat protein